VKEFRAVLSEDQTRCLREIYPEDNPEDALAKHLSRSMNEAALTEGTKRQAEMQGLTDVEGIVALIRCFLSENEREILAELLTRK